MPSLTSPQVLRALGAAWLIFFLLWLPFEDHHVLLPLILAIDLCVWLALRMWSFWSTLSDVFVAALVAGAWLAAVPVFTLGLMLFKGGLHGHGFPDFALRQFAMVLVAIPVCAALGAVVGAGTYLMTQKK